MVSPEPPDTGGPGKANSPVRSPPEADWTFHEWTHELQHDNGKQNPEHKRWHRGPRRVHSVRHPQSPFTTPGK